MRNLFPSLFFSILVFSGFSQLGIEIKQAPLHAYIEYGEHAQYLNFDFKISNTGKDTLDLSKITVSVMDSSGLLIHSRFLDDNGTAPSIHIIPNRAFTGGSTQLIFNPFYEFPAHLRLHTLIYDFTFADHTGRTFTHNIIIHPEKYEQRIPYAFPLKGNVLIYDAHDFFSHHRRFDFEFQPIKEFGLHSNFMRYAYDFVLLNEQNKSYHDDEKKDQNYFSFGQPVYAVAEGKVIYMASNYADDKNFDARKLINNPLELYGNCIAIQHNNGAVSVYGHLKQNSIVVKTGDMVRSGQEIARIGVSGSSFFPHLHFEMRTDLSNKAEGLPSSFSNIHVSKPNMRRISSGIAETGSIIYVQ